MLAPLLFVFGVFVWRIMETKICRKCGKEFELDHFYISKSNKDGYNSACKKCVCEYAKKHREENRDIIIKKSRDRYAQNKEEYSKKAKEYYQKNKEIIKKRSKEHRINHKEYYSEYHKQYRKDNKENLRLSKKQYHYEKMSSDDVYNFCTKIRTKIYQYFNRKGLTKQKHAEEILGCSIKDLKIYLNKTFFDNYGYEYDGIEKVHIDHIIPLATAKTVEDVEKLCHYTNLQLLRAEDNLKKGSKTDYEI